MIDSCNVNQSIVCTTHIFQSSNLGRLLSKKTDLLLSFATTPVIQKIGTLSVQPLERNHPSRMYLSNRSPLWSQTCIQRKSFLCLVCSMFSLLSQHYYCMTSTCQTGVPPRKFSGKVQIPMRMLRTKLYTRVQSETTVMYVCS